MPSPPPNASAVDLALAAELQAALLPHGCPSRCPNQDAAARNRMSNTIGGDFYDLMRLNEDQVAVVIGDCVGHGVRASLLMFKIMGWLRSDIDGRSRPTRVAAGLNRMLLELGDRTSASVPCSLFYAVVDIPTGLMVYVNAGHPMPILLERSSGGEYLLGSTNMLLGVQDFEPAEGCHTMAPGQRLLLYTDGLTDARDANDLPFSLDRLRAVTRQTAQTRAQDCVDAIFAAVDRFSGPQTQADDQTLVVFDRV